MSQTPRALDEHTPTTIVYDIAAETANELIGLLTHRSDTAADPATREARWQRVLAVRDARRAVDPLDRQALLDQISLWRTEIETLKAGR
ncbi:hypothetical protein [Streptomyces hydrogenans]|uniref:hypothetical protein n=1 Tax=Streptomyces hydrogenans TaxID=1873719 RepID=UPI00167E4B4B|nr:hypothetical protein [Streptomyces hydrogenans]GHE32299.1 hypothetical protein GCM10018784_80820 [Streptomyces hydrogenans]